MIEIEISDILSKSYLKLRQAEIDLDSLGDQPAVSITRLNGNLFEVFNYSNLWQGEQCIGLTVVLGQVMILQSRTVALILITQVEIII